MNTHQAADRLNGSALSPKVNLPIYIGFNSALCISFGWFRNHNRAAKFESVSAFINVRNPSHFFALHSKPNRVGIDNSGMRLEMRVVGRDSHAALRRIEVGSITDLIPISCAKQHQHLNCTYPASRSRVCHASEVGNESREILNSDLAVNFWNALVRKLYLINSFYVRSQQLNGQVQVSSDLLTLRPNKRTFRLQKYKLSLPSIKTQLHCSLLSCEESLVLSIKIAYRTAITKLKPQIPLSELTTKRVCRTWGRIKFSDLSRIGAAAISSIQHAFAAGMARMKRDKFTTVAVGIRPLPAESDGRQIIQGLCLVANRQVHKGSATIRKGDDINSPTDCAVIAKVQVVASRGQLCNAGHADNHGRSLLKLPVHIFERVPAHRCDRVISRPFDGLHRIRHRQLQFQFVKSGICSTGQLQGPNKRRDNSIRIGAAAISSIQRAFAVEVA